MKRLFYLTPIILVLGCASIFPSGEVGPYKSEETRSYRPKKVEPLRRNVFDASFDRVWSATLEGLKWMKWVPAFTDELEGTIRLKEAYVYRKSGKLLRIYNWPPRQELAQSSIEDYLKKVSDYNPGFGIDPPAFSQESMRIKLIGLSGSRVKVEIDYKIRPYFSSGRFTDSVKSSGYIESLLLERIKENLAAKPLARR